MNPQEELGPIASGSTVANMGLKTGDVIHKVKGLFYAFDEIADLHEVYADGETVTMDVIRGTVAYPRVNGIAAMIDKDGIKLDRVVLGVGYERVKNVMVDHVYRPSKQRANTKSALEFEYDLAIARSLARSARKRNNRIALAVAGGLLVGLGVLYQRVVAPRLALPDTR